MYIYATLCIRVCTALASCTHSRPHSFLQRRRARECRMWELCARQTEQNLQGNGCLAYMMWKPFSGPKMSTWIKPSPKFICMSSTYNTLPLDHFTPNWQTKLIVLFQDNSLWLWNLQTYGLCLMSSLTARCACFLASIYLTCPSHSPFVPIGWTVSYGIYGTQ